MNGSVAEPRPVPPVAIAGRELGACLAIGSIALLILGVQPVVLGPLVVEGRIAESGVGLLVTIEMLAIAIGSVLGTRLLRRVPARAIAVGASLLLAAADAAMAWHAFPLPIALLRAVTGLAVGMLLGLPIVAGARARDPEKVAAVFLVTQTALQLLVASIIPTLSWHGSRADAGFLTLAAFSLAAIAITVFLPAWLRPLAADRGTGGAMTRRGLAVLLSSATYLGGIVVVWSYLGLWLTLHGHPAEVEGRTVSWSLGAQILGALVAVRFDGRGRNRAVIVGGALLQALLVATLLAFGRSPAVVYAVSLAFGFLWLFVLPSFTGLLIELDPTRRVVLYLAGAQLGGAAMLPTLCTPVVNRLGVDGSSFFAIGAFALTAILCAQRSSAEL